MERKTRELSAIQKGGLIALAFAACIGLGRIAGCIDGCVRTNIFNQSIMNYQPTTQYGPDIEGVYTPKSDVKLKLRGDYNEN